MSSPTNTPERKALVEVSHNVVKLPTKNKALAPRAKSQPRRRKAVPKTILKTEPSQSEWVPLTEFTLFKKLPVEIRQLIWKLALPRTTVHELRWKFSHDFPNSRIRRDFHYGEVPVVVARCPALMQTCTEAREVGLKIFTTMMARKDIKVAVGEKIDPKDAFKLNVRGLVNNYIPEDHPDLVPNESWDDDPIRKVLPISVPKLNYFDLENDILYANWETWSARFDRDSKYGFVFPHRDFESHITQEDSDNIRHLAIDYRILTGGNENKYRQKPGYNALEWQLDALTDRGKFSNLEKLTIVITDHGSLRGLKQLPKGIGYTYQGPVTFADDADLGPYYRDKHRKGPRWFGPWENIATDFGIDPKTLDEDGPAVVKAAIAAEKDIVLDELEKLRKKYPEKKFPDVNWVYSFRNGRFRLH
ncbi:uncharacterized protein PAC_13984 [Phialocephala subalpina]|uniref:2EXR domain-containing protein n=1 Tax=Phialocephala subalpina TaxID=576137 RepID=A0A1L7XGL0_9HELO|nr:uncharacterized protein PAC_13984 [Phialocephala subalpina]